MYTSPKHHVIDDDGSIRSDRHQSKFLIDYHSQNVINQNFGSMIIRSLPFARGRYIKKNE